MEPTPILHFLGRLHPLVVHFPIALLLVAGFLQLLRGRRGPSEAILQCLTLGALGAVVAAGFGWLYAEHDPPGSGVAETLFWHRWLGVVTAVISVLCAALARRGTSGEAPTGYRLTLFGSVLLVAVGAHQGGALVYGPDYLFEVFEESPRRAVDPVSTKTVAEPSPAVEDPEPRATTTAVFAEEIRPIFERACFECHGPSGRAKGDLRLTDEAGLFEGDRDLWVVEPGQPDASFLIELVTLPDDDEDRMPPLEDPPLSADEIAQLRAWIAGLAPRDR